MTNDVLQVSVAGSSPGTEELEVRLPSSKTMVLVQWSPINFICKASKIISDCSIMFENFDPPEIKLDDHFNFKKYNYSGEGFDKGECGITWHKAQLDQSGKTSCLVTFPDGGNASAQIKISVLERPKESTLQSNNPKFQFKENDTMLFNCTAGTHVSNSYSFNTTIFLGNISRDVLTGDDFLATGLGFAQGSQKAEAQFNGQSVYCKLHLADVRFQLSHNLTVFCESTFNFLYL